jgi:hypothetical protein
VPKLSTGEKPLEVFMKQVLILTLLMSSIAFAETPKEANTRRSMVGRTDALISEITATREALEDQDVVKACSKLKSILVVYPEHLKGIGTNMSVWNKKITKAQDQSLEDLMIIHEQSLVCDRGDSCEYVDAEKLEKTLKRISKNLEKHRKLIKKNKVNYENSFNYSYEL